MISLYFPILWTVKILKESSNDHTLEAGVCCESTKKLFVTGNSGNWLYSANIISNGVGCGDDQRSKLKIKRDNDLRLKSSN